MKCFKTDNDLYSLDDATTFLVHTYLQVFELLFQNTEVGDSAEVAVVESSKDLDEVFDSPADALYEFVEKVVYGELTFEKEFFVVCVVCSDDFGRYYIIPKDCMTDMWLKHFGEASSRTIVCNNTSTPKDFL